MGYLNLGGGRSIPAGGTVGQVLTIAADGSLTWATPAAGGGGAVAAIADNFDRADTTSGLGTTSTGGKVWTQHSGTWGITAGRAYDSTNNPTTELVSVDAGAADATVSARLYKRGSGASRYFGLAVRLNSTGTDGYIVQVQGVLNQLIIQKLTAGSSTALGSPVAYTMADADLMTVVLSGSSITAKINGAELLTRTDSSFATNTRHGLWTYTDQGAFDDFSITA